MTFIIFVLMFVFFFVVFIDCSTSSCAVFVTRYTDTSSQPIFSLFFNIQCSMSCTLLSVSSVTCFALSSMISLLDISTFFSFSKLDHIKSFFAVPGMCFTQFTGQPISFVLCTTQSIFKTFRLQYFLLQLFYTMSLCRDTFSQCIDGGFSLQM